MNKFETPVMEVVSFIVEDVVTASSISGPPPLGGDVVSPCMS